MIAPIKAIIIEDEYPAAERLRKMILREARDLEVLACLESVSASIKWLKTKEKPDLIFSDIQLSDGLSFEIYEQIDVPCPIIFTTAYDEYAIKAFRVKSIDYLLKPIKSSELKAAIDKYKSFREGFSALSLRRQLEEVWNQLKQPVENAYKDRFLVSGKEKFIPVRVEEIAYFYTQREIVYLIKKNGRRHSIDYKLEGLEAQLDPRRFFRVNRQYICQVDAIQQILPYFHGRLKLALNPETEEDIIVSREKAKEFKAWMGA